MTLSGMEVPPSRENNRSPITVGSISSRLGSPVCHPPANNGRIIRLVIEPTITAAQKQNKTNKTKQNKTKQNKTKQNKTKQNKTKQNKTKQNKTKQNKTKQNKTKQNKTKQTNKQTNKTKQNKNKKRAPYRHRRLMVLLHSHEPMFNYRRCKPRTRGVLTMYTENCKNSDWKIKSFTVIPFGLLARVVHVFWSF